MLDKEVHKLTYPFLFKFVEVIQNTDLGATSKKNYEHRLHRLVQLTNKDIDWVLSNCMKTLDILKKQNITEPQSLKALINSILTLFKHTKNLKLKRKKEYTCWIQQFKIVNAKAEEKYDKIQPSKRQIEAYVPWNDIILKRDELDKDSNAYLLLCLYTMLPPARADMNCVKIVSKSKLTDAEIKKHPNHIIVLPTGMKLVYNEFKTKSRKLQRYEKVLPQELVDVIQHSLKIKPREYLIVSPKTNNPYIKSNSFTQYFDRLLTSIFKKRMSINTLRHSFVNSVDMNKVTPLEKELLARDMMHSPEMFDRYRLVIPAEQSDDKKAKVCDVVCRDA
jgi:hypothetical protein